jgi:DNA-binding NtrC family response regulator
MGEVRAALVVDRDPEVRETIREALEERGLITLGAPSAAEADEHLQRSNLVLIFLDMEMAAKALESLIARTTERRPAPVLIGMSAHEGGGAAGRHRSLHDMLRKPLDGAVVRFRADRALELLSLLSEERRLRSELKKKLGFDGLVGRCTAIERLRDKIATLAAGEGSVWITGEKGTGKRLIARILHDASPRRGRPFRAIDCSSADEPPAIAGEGTIYLEQPSALPHALQQELLDELEKVATEQPRVLAGSQGEPIAEIKLGRLLPELHAALASSSLYIPPLRERENDIALLAQHFIATIAEINNLPPLRISAKAMAALDDYGWPGNVRELRDCIEKAVILAVGGEIAPHDLPGRLRRESGEELAGVDAARLSAKAFRDAKRSVVDSFEKAYLTELLQRFGGNVTTASKHAGMLRSALQRLLRKHDLRSADFRRKGPSIRGGSQVKPAVE